MPSQKPTAKRAAAPKTFAGEVRSQGNEMKRMLLSWVQHWDKFRNILKNNFDLGRDHLKRGNLSDAILRFRFVLWLDPQFKDAWYYLGCSHLADGNARAARDAFTSALRAAPGNDEARYMLAITMGRAMPRADLPRVIPRSLLLEQFESLAPTFTAEQLSTFRYEGHTHLTNAIRSALVQGRMDHIMLELGVGTGLCGPLLRDVASHITGVDISPAMLAEAVKVTDERGRKIYDSLIRREALEFLADGPVSSYDIVLGAGLVSYIGELQPFFEQSARVLKSGGLLAFTADKFEGTGVQFNPETGRFGYAQSYLADLAARFGLTEIKSREAVIYPESAGWLCVFGRQ